MFELQKVTKQFAGEVVLHEIDLRVEPGSTLVLLGPSGCGKTTLLRLLLLLTTPDDGTVLFDGTPVHANNVLALRRRIGYVVQQGGLFPHLTARQNVLLVAQYLKWDEQRMESRLAELAELTRLDIEFLDRYPAQLSGGQRQRIGIMRALLLNPDALLLDEPLGALDPMVRAELQQDMRQAFRTLGKTVIMVTHDLAEAAYFADTIVLLKQGRIVQQGSAGDLQHRPAEPFVSEFVGAQQSHWLEQTT